MNIPLTSTAVLCWVTLASGVLTIATDGTLRSTLWRFKFAIAACLALTFAWRLQPEGRTFLGLEYEDAYVYTAAARQIDEHAMPPGTPTFFASVCDAGSAPACIHWNPSSGHYLGSAYVFALAMKLLGYTPEIGHVVALVSAGFTVVLLFCLTAPLSDDSRFPVATGAIYATTPLFAVEGLGSFAEPLSSFCSTLALLGYVRLLYGTSGRMARITAGVTAGIAMLFAMVVKRENLLIAVVIPAVALALRLRPSPAANPGRKIVGWTVAIAAGAVVFAIAALHFPAVLAGERVEFGETSFSAHNLGVLLPAFLRSFSNARWYALTLFPFAAGCILVRRTNRLVLETVCLFAAFLLLYASHARSAYQIQQSAAAPFDALRYSINLMTYWAVVAGFGTTRVLARLEHTVWFGRHRLFSRGLCGAFVFAYLGLCYVYTRDLGEDLSREEDAARIQPARAILKAIEGMDRKRVFVITPEPLLIQIYGRPLTQVIGLNAVNRDLLEALTAQVPSALLVYAEYASYRNPVDQRRFREPLRVLAEYARQTLLHDSRFDIVMLSAAPQSVQLWP